MEKNTAHFETLKQILRQARHPDELDNHPWTRSLIVQEAVNACPEMAQANPGQQLIGALARLFVELQPATPPRVGKRLDPRWGEYGLLAALYFTPFNHGTSFPTSLLEAWRRIDCAILHSVFGSPAEKLSEEQIRKYRLVGEDVEFGSPSTLSDWHKKGLQRFTEITLNRERFLARNSAKASPILEGEGRVSITGPESMNEQSSQAKKRSPIGRRLFWSSLGLLLLLALGLGSWKAWDIYQRGLLVYEDVDCLRQLMQRSTDAKDLDGRCSALVPETTQANAAAPSELRMYERAIPVLEALQTDLIAFKQEAQPLLRLSPRLKWVPVYGYDIASAPSLIEMAEHLLNTSLLASRAADPLLREFVSADSQRDIAGMTALLLQAGPQIEQARLEMDKALEARNAVPADQLSPRLRGLILDELDPRLELADEALSLAQALPGLLGAGSDGPKTYLVLVENEHELRPTGGFITAVGNLVVHDGMVMRLSFEDSGEQENWSRPYPSAPWQLQEYMNSPVLILRDANWFSDFPTTARWAEYLYAYTHDHSVDGVISVDQRFLMMLLEQLGPLEMEGAEYPVDARNVTEYMVQAKQPPPGEPVPPGWSRKEFISVLANALLKKLNEGDHDWKPLMQTVFQALAERHLLLQFDDPVIASLVAQQGWDSAIRPAGGDYLMVTDTNIGFNKTNAVVDIRLDYDVDLSNLEAPSTTLTLIHQNNAAPDVPCLQWGSSYETRGQDAYPIDRCYWNYLRIYKQADVQLRSATPHAIPGDWMILQKDVPARVDALEEEIPGVQGFGTLLVVPGGSALNTSFEFDLPVSVLAEGSASGEYIYHLKIQKQPGTLANPLTLRIHLPSHAVWMTTPAGATLQNNHLLLETNLRVDREFDVTFTVP